jgi:imidazolonepropionase-like amidohydrolase
VNRTTFVNARIFDGVQSEYLDESVVVVEGDRIVAVDRTPGALARGDVVDVGGKTLMPGLIDAHCHVLGASLKVTDIETQPLTYVASYASKMLGHALDCGFTTVRDVGGGDAGIARAVADRLIRGPRVFFAGRALSMTGGHGDFRDPFSEVGACGCSADGRVASSWTARMRSERRLARSCAAGLIASRSCCRAAFYRRPIPFGWINLRTGKSWPRSKRPPAPKICRSSLSSAELHRTSGEAGSAHH